MLHEFDGLDCWMSVIQSTFLLTRLANKEVLLKRLIYNVIEQKVCRPQTHLLARIDYARPTARQMAIALGPLFSRHGTHNLGTNSVLIDV